MEPREKLQVLDDVAIVGVEPELEEIALARARGIEPHGTRFGLAELRAGRRRDERQPARVRAGASHPVPASVLPNCVPAAVVTSGSTRPCALPPSTRRIRSQPATM